MSDHVEDHGGAARAWTSLDPQWVAWRGHIERGDLKAADALVGEDVEALELTRRIRYEFSFDRAAILAKLREELPDLAESELDAWTASGAIEGRPIDGEMRWFRREPRNLFLHDQAARQRRLDAGRPLDRADRHSAEAPIVPHLVKAIAAADESGGSKRVLPVRTSFLFVVTLKPNVRGLQKGSRVQAWLPFPQQHRHQKDVVLIATTPVEHKLSPPTAKQRTIYFEQTIADPAKPVRFEMSVEFVTSAVVPRESAPAKYDQPTPEDLLERLPHIAFTDEVKRIVDALSEGALDNVTLAKRIWNWIDDNVPWTAEHEYSLVPSIVAHGLKNRRGDCGVQSIIFISMCRYAGIPARWLSGWTTEPVRGGMHDWSEIWLDALGGWVTVDTSYGKKKHDDPRVRDFYFGGVDAFRMIVNTDFGRELHPPLKGLRAEPLDFQRGEVTVDGRVLYYDEWDYSFTVDHEWLKPFGEEHAGGGDRRSRGRR